MSPELRKLKQFILPYFGISIGLPILYGVVFYYFELDSIHFETFTFYIPVALSFLVTFLFFTKRLHSLTIGKNHPQFINIYLFIAGFGISVASVSLIDYISKKTRFVAETDNINHHNLNSEFEYIKIHSYEIDRDRTKFKLMTGMHKTGEYHQNLRMNVYLSIPFKQNKNSKTNFWFCESYTKSISNVFRESKEQELNTFKKECINEFNLLLEEEIDFFERIPAGSAKNKFIELTNNKSTLGTRAIFLKPKFGTIKNHTTENLPLYAILYVTFSLAFYFMILFSKFKDEIIEKK